MTNWRGENSGPLHTSRGLWPCNYEGPWFSSKSCSIDMACRNPCHTYLSEVSLLQISVDHDTLCYNMSCRNPCILFIHDNIFRYLGHHILMWKELGWSQPLRWSLDGLNQWEILDYNGHGPSISWVTNRESSWLQYVCTYVLSVSMHIYIQTLEFGMAMEVREGFTAST